MNPVLPFPSEYNLKNRKISADTPSIGFTEDELNELSACVLATICEVAEVLKADPTDAVAQKHVTTLSAIHQKLTELQSIK